jgi:hypothetical protein
MPLRLARGVVWRSSLGTAMWCGLGVRLSATPQDGKISQELDAWRSTVTAEFDLLSLSAEGRRAVGLPPNRTAVRAAVKPFRVPHSPRGDGKFQRH